MVNRLNNNRVFITETTHFDSSDCSRSGSLITTAMTLDQYLKHRNVIKVLARIQPSFGANWRKQQQRFRSAGQNMEVPYLMEA